MFWLDSLNSFTENRNVSSVFKTQRQNKSNIFTLNFEKFMTVDISRSVGTNSFTSAKNVRVQFERKTIILFVILWQEHLFTPKYPPHAQTSFRFLWWEISTVFNFSMHIKKYAEKILIKIQRNYSGAHRPFTIQQTKMSQKQFRV